MTLLTIAKAVARNVAVQPPTAVLSNTSPEIANIVQFTLSAGEEIARRVDWNTLRKTTTLTGTGANVDFALPGDFGRLTVGMAVSMDGRPLRGGLSSDEWASMVPVEGTARYFRLAGGKMSFFPFPMSGDSINVTYQTNNWNSNGTAAWSADDNTALVPEVLIQMNAIWRWKRHIGADYHDQLAEFETALTQYAQFDGGVRLP